MDFEELVASRREWIDSVLADWCRQARLLDLRRASMDWVNLAGSVDTESTLWTWAWSRFPALTHDGITGVNETHEVRVRLVSGTVLTGFPDNEQTEGGQLVLMRRTEDGFEQDNPVSIDEIESVEFVDTSLPMAAPDLPDRQPTTLPPQLPDDQRI